MKMRMKILIGLIAFMVSVGCLSMPAKADIIAQNNEEVKSIAEPVLDNILSGFELNEYEVYARDFDATLREAVSQQKFKETKAWLDQALGPCLDKEYLGYLNQGQMTVVLWKGKFNRTENDVLIKLVMSKRGAEYFVTGLWFQ